MAAPPRRRSLRSYRDVVLLVAALVALAVVLVCDRWLPQWMPMRAFYPLLVAAVFWYNRPIAVVAALVSISDQVFIDDVLVGAGEYAWDLGTRILLYSAIFMVLFTFKHTQRQLSHAALTDPLTGLANRRQFEAVAQAEIDRAARYYHPLSVAVLDVNAFKGFNDTEGHVAGDNILRRIGGELTHNLRATDTVARIGGDEFAVILPETDEAAAGVALEHVLTQIAEIYPAGVSVGVHEYSVQVPSVEALLNSSDQQMYRVKRANL